MYLVVTFFETGPESTSTQSLTRAREIAGRLANKGLKSLIFEKIEEIRPSTPKKLLYSTHKVR